MKDRIAIDRVVRERVASVGIPLASAPTVNRITRRRRTVAVGRTLRVETARRRDGAFESYAVKLMPTGRLRPYYVLVVELGIDVESGVASLGMDTQYGFSVRHFDESDVEGNVMDAKRTFDRVSRWIFGNHDVDLGETPRSALRSAHRLARGVSERFGLKES